MKKQVFEFVKKNPMATHHQCAAKLGISELEAMKLLRQLKEAGYLRKECLPLGNSLNPNCSDMWRKRNTPNNKTTSEAGFSRPAIRAFRKR